MQQKPAQQSTNNLTLNQLPEMAKALIEKEHEAARYTSPVDKAPFTNFQKSPFKLMPMTKPGEFRLLHNISHPYDNIPVNSATPEECS